MTSSASGNGQDPSAVGAHDLVSLGNTGLGWQQHITLAASLATGQVGPVLMGATDIAVVGRYSSDALAGVGVGNAIVFGISCFGMGLVTGLDAVAPAAIARGDRNRAHLALVATLRLAVVVGLGLTALLLLSPLALPLLGIDDSVAAEAKRYILARCPGVVPFVVSVALRSYLAAFGSTRIVVVSTVVALLCNLVLDVGLVFGVPWIGIPALGVVGSALATSFVLVLQCALFAWSARKLWPRELGLQDDPKLRAEIVSAGMPLGLHMVVEVGVFAVAGVLAAHLSRDAAGAHSVAITIASFSFAISLGIGSATSTQVGYASGLGSPSLMRKAGTRGVIAGSAVMATSAILFLVMPEQLVNLFTDQTGVREIAVPLLAVAAVFQFSDGAQAVLAGALRGAGETKIIFVANLIGHWAVGFGISLALGFGAGLGVTGIWWGLSAGLSVTAALLFWRFWRLTASEP